LAGNREGGQAPLDGSVQAGRVGDVRDDRRDRRVGDPAAGDGVTDREEVGAAAREQDGEPPRLGHQAGGGGSTTTRRSPPALTLPMANQRCPASFQIWPTRARSAGATKTTMPIPMLKTRCISSNETSPSRPITSKTGGTSQAPDFTRTSRP